ncbi:E3 ubiquitin-protein ligase BRE1A-like [Belonocnema kinseyi]|uniref:E3 ubiquitin-protein ligase BRE1A-like n=1 Tax=Belonocnema kinseyi TaxID=2817044 RepID=UPI00143DA1D3|nr:E3 ubiquitin-protein ligase BRE1A-like [Belonocnema kinseyi]
MDVPREIFESNIAETQNVTLEVIAAEPDQEEKGAHIGDKKKSRRRPKKDLAIKMGNKKSSKMMEEFLEKQKGPEPTTGEKPNEQDTFKKREVLVRSPVAERKQSANKKNGEKGSNGDSDKHTSEKLVQVPEKMGQPTEVRKTQNKEDSGFNDTGGEEIAKESGEKKRTEEKLSDAEESYLETMIERKMARWWEKKIKPELEDLKKRLKNLEEKRRVDLELIQAEQEIQIVEQRWREMADVSERLTKKVESAVEKSVGSDERKNSDYNSEGKSVSQRETRDISAQVGQEKGNNKGEQSGEISNRRKTDGVGDKQKPDFLRDGELIWEKEERRKRKNWVIVRGFRSRGKLLDKEISSTIEAITGVRMLIQKMKGIAGGTLIKLKTWDNKRNLMANKHKLRGTRIKVEDDFTEREKQIQDWIESQIREARDRGLEASTSYM